MPRLIGKTAALAAAWMMVVSPAMAQSRAVGARPLMNTPEGGLWDLSDKAEAAARSSGELESDPALQAYLRGVVCKVAAEYCADLRIYVMDRPAMNATIAPNGYAEVWSGLLLRVEDEAELAFVLGHEASHFAENHSLKAHEAMKSRANGGLLVMGLLGGGALGQLAYLGVMSGVFTFSREQEDQADSLGLARAAAAGYRPSAAPDLWRDIMAETAASDSDKTRKSGARVGLFDTHPAPAARLAALERQAAALPATGDSGRERLRAAIRPHLGAWLKRDLARQDFGQTLSILDRLARSGEDLGVISFYRGEAYRQRRKDGDLGRAGEAYAASVAYPDAPAAAWRELGDARRRAGDAAGARTAYESYLTKAATADDAWMVQDALQGLAKGS